MTVSVVEAGWPIVVVLPALSALGRVTESVCPQLGRAQPTSLPIFRLLGLAVRLICVLRVGLPVCPLGREVPGVPSAGGLYPKVDDMSLGLLG
jgi:hypothetical protein